jgi:protein-L-isoaspartate O-methyltransferase
VRDDPFHVIDPSDREQARQARQAERLRPHTLRLLTAAGLKPGDKVLDVGAGTGDAAFLAASLVGPQGVVIGVDRDPSQCEQARHRAERLGLENVAFLTADVEAFQAEGLFDAVIGRLVLAQTPDLQTLLDGLAGLARPGGVLAFHELDWRSAWRPRAQPQSLVEDEDLLKAFRLVADVCEKAGGALDIGVRLPALLARWGAPAAMIVTHVAVGRAQVAAAAELALEAARSLLPAATRLGLVGEDAPDLDGALDRLHARLGLLGEAEPAMEGPQEVLAFARKSMQAERPRAASQHES